LDNIEVRRSIEEMWVSELVRYRTMFRGRFSPPSPLSRLISIDFPIDFPLWLIYDAYLSHVWRLSGEKASGMASAENASRLVSNLTKGVRVFEGAEYR
jgi:hypothetical protein